MEKRTILEKGLSANRNLLAIIVITLTIGGIILISYFYFVNTSRAESSERIFGSLLPLFATWVGTVLAFYFGRENFEAASNRYENIINKLSPDLLDDVSVSQIMITRKTMVGMDIQKASKLSVKQLLEFLVEVDKTRLPIFEKGRVKYIVHKSTFLDSLITHGNSDGPFQDFIEKYESLVSNFLEISENEVLENIRKRLTIEQNIRDVFIVDSNKIVIGWLTDTLIIRYMKD